VHYGQLLDQVHQTLLPKVYLEVGVRHGDTLRLALSCTRAIGVDPSPKVLVALGEHVTVHELTSDAFFSSKVAEAALAGETIDVAFIDGMHLFEFVLRDFCNIERHSNPDSVVFVHDCLPRSPEEASRVPIVLGWTGDVWKLLPLLSELRPDLEITVINAPPTGLVMIRNLDASSQVIDPTDKSILARFHELELADLAITLENLTLLESDWELIAPRLPAPYQTDIDVPALVAQRDALKPDLATRWRKTRRTIGRSPAGQLLIKFRGGVRSVTRRART
jgi:hypothetical protein